MEEVKEQCRKMQLSLDEERIDKDGKTYTLSDSIADTHESGLEHVESLLHKPLP